MLKLKIEKPWTERVADSALVSVVDSDGTRQVIATCTIGGGAEDNVSGSAVRLAQAGVQLFGGVYSAGEPLEPFASTLDRVDTTRPHGLVTA